jgi:hypothetical protein
MTKKSLIHTNNVSTVSELTVLKMAPAMTFKEPQSNGKHKNVKKRKANRDEGAPVILGAGKETIAIIEGLGIVSNFMASDDLNECVDAALEKHDRNVLACVVTDPLTERDKIRKRDLKGKSAEIKAYLQ